VSLRVFLSSWVVSTSSCVLQKQKDLEARKELQSG